MDFREEIRAKEDVMQEMRGIEWKLRKDMKQMGNVLQETQMKMAMMKQELKFYMDNTKEEVLQESNGIKNDIAELKFDMDLMKDKLTRKKTLKPAEDLCVRVCMTGSYVTHRRPQCMV